MKKNILFIFIFILFFAFNIDVNAAMLKECKYTKTGLSNYGGVTLRIYDDKSPELIYSDDTVSIDNWFEVFYSELTYIGAKKFSETNECPDFVVDTLHFAADFAKDYLVLDEETMIRLTELVDSLSLLRVWKYADDNNTGVVDPVCDYGAFKLKLNDDRRIVHVEYESGDNEYFPTVETYLSAPDIPEDKCPVVYTCQYTGFEEFNSSIIDDNGYHIVYSDPSMLNFDYENCRTVAPKENAYNITTCLKYTMFMNGTSRNDVLGLKDYSKKYIACSDTNAACKSETLSGYNTQKSIVTEWCNTILSSADYNDSCLKSCLNLNNDIYSLEKKMGLTVDGNLDEDTCGFGERLVLWIANIMKWLKYIVPVIVIVFGILDFIRAMSADKDDEMKKAQKKFITRLIAAALVFIIPFIIEFILNAFNFDFKGCGII